MASRGKILALAADRTLADEIRASHMGGEFEVAAVLGAQEAAAALALPGQSPRALVVDLAQTAPAECERLVRLHAEKASFSTFLLKPDYPISPSQAAPLRTLYWPLAPGFAGEAAAAPRPIVFFVERTLFMAKAIQLSFKDTGLEPVILQSAKGLAEFLIQRPAPLAPAASKSAWGKFVDAFIERPAPVYTPKTAVKEPPRLILSHIIAALVSGEAEARAADAEVRGRVGDAVCYYVTNADPLLAAAKALRERAPVPLLRSQASLIAGMLASSPARALTVEKAPLILMDHDQERLAGLAQALLAAGYRVEMAKDDKEVLKLACARGRFQLAVIGMTFGYSFSYGVDAGTNLAQRLRETDPDMRFIFMVDLYPLERAVREMSRCIEFGGDDAFVKPVEPPRLLLSVERALKRRRMAIEMTKLNREGTAAARSSGGGEAGLVDGRYDLVFQIGEGGMGVVFLASDRQLGRKVALKKMRPEIKANPAHREKFMEEAKIISHLNHPYIVGIHEIIEDDGEIYLVLDYVDGKSLAQILHERKRLPLKECAHIFFQVCQGVDSAHRNHVLHRDLKPSNIMIDANGYAKVMDFGLARETKDTITMLTQKDTGGTLAYMAPEQHLGRGGRASDIYSLGICLYEMLTGQLPFRGPDFLSQKERMMFTPASTAVPGLPPAIDKLLSAALAPDPRGRIQDATKLLESLRRIPA